MIRNFYDTLKSLLPNGRAFRIPDGTQFRNVNEALGEEPDRIREYFDDTRDSGLPGKIPAVCFGEWETMLNLLYDPTLSDSERQARIMARIFAVGGQGAEYLEDALNLAGYPITIYDNIAATENLSGKYNAFGRFNDAITNEILTEVPAPLEEYGKYLTGKFEKPVGNRIEDINVMACGNLDKDVIVGQSNLNGLGRLYYSSDYADTFVEIQPAGNVDKKWGVAKLGHSPVMPADNSAFAMCGVYGGRLYKSVTGYTNLVETQPAGNTDQNWNCLACTPNGKYILAGTSGKRLWYSANYGAAWAEVRPLGNTDQTWSCCAISEDGLYQVAGTPTRLYLSSNNGAAWAEIRPLGNADKQWSFCSICNSGRYIVAAALDDDIVKRSADFGATWATILDDTYFPDDMAFWFNGQADYYNYCIMLYGGLGLGNGWVYVTCDCGESWARYSPAQYSPAGSQHEWRMAVSMIAGEKTYRNHKYLYFGFVTNAGDSYPTELNISRMEQLYNSIGIIAGATIDTVLTFAYNLAYDFFDLIYKLKPLGTWLNCKLNFKKDWAGIVQVGNSKNIPAIGWLSMASMSNNRIAIIDSTQKIIRCYEWDGTDWTYIPNFLIISVAITNPVISSTKNGDIFFIDSTYENLGMYRFNGSRWSRIGEEFPIAGISNIAICRLTDSVAVFIDSTLELLRCFRFDGYSWSIFGNSLNIAGIDLPAITALNETDIAYIDNTNQDLRCYRFDGTDWAQVGNDLNIAGATYPVICSINETDIILADETHDQLRCYRFDGTDWAQVGVSFTLPAFGSLSAITRMTNDTFAFIDSTNENLTTYRIY